MLCKICGGETSIIRHEKSGVDYHRCSVCDFIYKDPAAVITPEQELYIYDQHNNSIEDPRYVRYFKDFIDNAIMSQRIDGYEGLDFGSGPSPVLAMILERDYHFKMDIYDLFYAPEKVYLEKKYDLITTTEVVEHFMDPMAYFKLFRSLMKENSLLAVMTQFHPKSNKTFLKWHYIRDDSHISFYSHETMRKIAELLELEIVYMDKVKNTAFRIKQLQER